MPRTVLTLQPTTRNGLQVTYVAGDAANNHSFDNAGQDIILHVINGATVTNITVITPGLTDGEAIADKVINVPATEDRFIGPFRNDLYGQAEPDAGFPKSVFVDIDDDVNVTIAAIEVGDVNF